MKNQNPKQTVKYWQDILLPKYLLTPARKNPLTRLAGNSFASDINKGGSK